ncbi:MAG: acetyl-CoA carboxylase biotin carboxylase subunit [Halioglobus sp.]|nr:acetyl-CoA carboxylase biotin carboxylase subunit [Halioglobus sp.]
MFNKILIANRGEITCRVIRTARALGVATVAIYSDADRDALHVRQADEAIYVGAAPASESYLRTDRIISAAQATGAEAIHPGYGFLAENADFARACTDNGFVFIGPSAEAIEMMGSKSTAKRIMKQASIPLVPGYHDKSQDAARLRTAARTIGYPVLLKATAGGGGKGMRIVHDETTFDDALDSAKREALASFGDDRMLVEKYLDRPRHVEVQVFCDNQGKAIYLAERDCSVQRRHQKLIEEAPAPHLDSKLRHAMGQAAVRAAQAIAYRGAGTVEFLLDQSGQFYFMEMNTRLQVEHPVTELITGQDLVEWQLRVACGEPLPVSQENIRLHGHAFEARIYAEDPANDFLPQAGTLTFLQAPEESRYVRVDTGVSAGDEITMHYDPLIAKLIVWDESRERALNRLALSLTAYRVGGSITNIDFLYNLATATPFIEGHLSTHFVEDHRDLVFRNREQDLTRELPAAALALLLHEQRKDKQVQAADPFSPWIHVNAWRLNEPHIHRRTLRCQQQDHVIELEQQGEKYRAVYKGRQTWLAGSLQGDTLQLESEGHRQRCTFIATQDGYTLYFPQGACHFQATLANLGETAPREGDAALRAPMNGTVIRLLVTVGEVVEPGTPLLIMEAMKMEHTVKARCTGTVEVFHFQPGDRVDGGALLLDLRSVNS